MIVISKPKFGRLSDDKKEERVNTAPSVRVNPVAALGNQPNPAAFGLAANSGYTEAKQRAAQAANRQIAGGLLQRGQEGLRNTLSGYKDDAETQRERALLSKMGLGENWGDPKTAFGSAIESAAANTTASLLNAAGTLLVDDRRHGLAVDSGDVEATETDVWHNRWGQGLQSNADKVQQISEEAYARGSENLNAAEQVLFDLGIAGAQMLGDMAAGPASPYLLAARGFGSGAMQARQAGGGIGQQVVYGGLSAGLELLAEKMFDGVAKAYGKGAADDVIQKVAEKLAKTPQGQSVIRAIANAGGEGLEEMISAIVDPALQTIYNDKTINGRQYGEKGAYDDVKIADILYDGLIGTLLGSIGGGIDIYQTAKQNPVKRMVETLKQAGASDEDAEKLAPMMASLLNGEEISGNQAAAIATNEAAIKELQAQTGKTINTDAPLGEVKKAVRELAARQSAQASESATEDTPKAETAQTASESETGNIITRMGKMMGKAGETVMNGMYAEGQDATQYAESMVRAYNAGLNGRDISEAKILRDENGAAVGVTDMQINEAFKAGQTDAQTALAKEKAAANYAKIAGTDSGLVYDDYVSERLGKTTAERVNSVAKALGVRVRFVDSVAGGEANAQYSGSEILIEKDNPNPTLFLLGHEWTHRMQDLAPEAYRDFRNALASDPRFEAAVEDRIRLYKEHGRSISYDAAADEVAADHAGALLQDGKMLDEFIAKHKENRTVLEKMLDAIRDLIRKLTGSEKRMAQTVEGKLMAALETATEQAGSLTENKKATQEGGELRYSIKRTSQMTLAAQLKMFYDGKMASSDALYFGETPSTLDAAGLDILPLAFTATDFRKSSKGKHNVPRRVWKNLHTSLENALFAFRVGDRIGVMTGDIDGDGKPLLVGIERNAIMDREPVNAIRSVYGLDNPGPWLRNQFESGKEYIPLNKKRADAFLQTYGAYLATVGEGIRSTDDTIAQNETESKKKFSLKTDNQGRTLTEAQQEYFKDSAVRDENGKLLTVYHGTNQGDFTKFEWDKTQRADGGFYGRGHYFTANKKMAEIYGARVLEGYLNIKNPFVWSEKINSYKGREVSNIQARNVAARINMAKVFPKLFANKTMEYGRFNNVTGEMETKSIKWSDLEKEIAKTESALKLLVFSDNSVRWAYSGDFWDVPVGDTYSNAKEAEKYKFESAVQAFVDTHTGIARNMTFDDQTSWTQDYGTEISEALIAMKYDGAMQNMAGDEIVAFNSNQFKNVDNTDPTADADINHSLKGTTALLEEYGAIEPGEKPVRDVQVPQKTEKNKNVSKTVRTIMEAGATPEELLPNIEELVVKGDFSYETYSDKEAVGDAESTIKNVGWAKALTDWEESLKKGEVSKANTAMGWALYNNAANSGDTQTALTVLDYMVKHQRSAAQALQATRILKKLSPETQLYQAQQSVNNLQEDLNKKYGDAKSPKLKIDEELAKRFMTARDQDARDAVMKEIYRDIGKQLPSTFMDKWNAWRYLAMLGNARTHGRNFIGNAMFAPVVATKNLTATAIESMVSRVSGGKLQRTKSIAMDQKVLKAAWDDYAKVAETAMDGGKYSDMANANKYIEEGRRVFKFSPLESARRGNSKALEKEDEWFSKPHYAAAMASYCKANGITAEQIAKGGEAVNKARAYAIKEAQKATYRDTNAFSQMVSGWGRKGGKNSVEKGMSMVMEGILPFRKTPANILVRGLEYSPVGLMNGIKQTLWDVSRGNKTGAEAIDTLSAGLTGTGLMALGIYWAAEGLVRGHGDKEEEKNKFMELMGHQAYALELPNGTSVTLDWLAPECLPFFVGVNLWEQTGKENDKVTLSSILDSVSMVTEPFMEMSCLQSLNDVFDAVGYASDEGLDALPSALASSVTSYLTQGLPTLLGQGERSYEDVRMTTYTEKNAFLTGDMQYALGKASARIPGWDYQQIPYIDAWGRKESSGAVGERSFNNFINPAYTSDIDESAMEKELLRLYETTGETKVFPDRAAKYFNVDKVRIDLTADQYVKYATAKGQTAQKLMTALTKSSAYKAMSNADKVDAVSKVYEYANAVAKTKVSGYKLDGWAKKAYDVNKKTGVKIDQYISLYLAEGDIGSLKDKSGNTIDNSHGLLVMEEIYKVKGLTDEQRQALFEAFGVGKKVRHYNKALVAEKLAQMRNQ